MNIPKDKIEQAVREKIDTIKSVKSKTDNLEARINELALYQDDSEPLQHVQPAIITKTTDLKNVQTMIRSFVVAKHEEALATIDSSPAEALSFFDYSQLSDADKLSFREIYKTAIGQTIATGQSEIEDITGIKF
jgi:hypothetical protein